MTNSELSQFTKEQLEEELERRNKVQPYPLLGNIDWKPLIDYLQDGVKRVCEKRRLSEDFEHYVFETACDCAFGEKFWAWWNEQAYKED